MKALRGCGSGIVLLACAIALLTLSTSIKPANPDELVAPWLFYTVLVVGGALVISAWRGKINFIAMMIIFAIAGGLILLNSTPAMPSGGKNPCPGDEIVIAVGGRCYGMDADKNRARLDGMVR